MDIDQDQSRWPLAQHGEHDGHSRLCYNALVGDNVMLEDACFSSKTALI